LRDKAGGDRRDGGGGRDRLYGGVSRDLFYARDGIRDRIEGGAGGDCARVDSRLDVTVSVYMFF
jgi:Ca2+-binding RTX toxin-like protein